ncbi:MAG: hypothetical protein J5605_09195 [Bacteroidales bacterium]|nr:hypothetical protein [Bacteroidales bacterium]
MSYKANRSELTPVLVLFKAKIDRFDALIHPIMGSELTSDLVLLDGTRDNYLVGFRYGVQFNLHHYDPLKVAAAKEIKMVLNNASYKEVYHEEYIQETDTIENLVDELQQNHAAALTTLGMTEFVQKLAEANTAFDDMLESRTNKRVRDYNYKDIKAARIEMERAFDTFRDQLNVFARMEEEAAGTMPGGTGTPAGGAGASVSYKDLVIRINDYIDIATKDSPDYDDEDDDDEIGDNNQGGETPDNNGTDPNQGEDNTPSADA